MTGLCSQRGSPPQPCLPSLLGTASQAVWKPLSGVGCPSPATSRGTRRGGILCPDPRISPQLKPCLRGAFGTREDASGTAALAGGLLRVPGGTRPSPAERQGLGGPHPCCSPSPTPGAAPAMDRPWQTLQLRSPHLLPSLQVSRNGVVLLFCSPFSPHPCKKQQFGAGFRKKP